MVKAGRSKQVVKAGGRSGWSKRGGQSGVQCLGEKQRVRALSTMTAAGDPAVQAPLRRRPLGLQLLELFGQHLQRHARARSAHPSLCAQRGRPLPLPLPLPCRCRYCCRRRATRLAAARASRGLKIEGHSQVKVIHTCEYL